MHVAFAVTTLVGVAIFGDTAIIIVVCAVQPAALVPVTVYVVVAVGTKLTPFVTPPLHV